MDIHVHVPFRRLGETEVGWKKTFDKMLRAARKAGIDRQVILGLSRENEIIKEIVNEYPNELIGFVRGWCTDPNMPNIIEKFVREYGFKGVKIHGEYNWSLYGLLGAHAIFLKAAELNIPVLIHSWHEEEGLPQEVLDMLMAREMRFPVRIIAELGKRFPDTKFIFAHMGGMWAKALEAAKPYPNIYFDTSGFDPERGIIEEAVEIVGSERLLFGSDAPGRSYVAQLAKVKYADISKRDKRRILGENAIELLGL